MPKAKKKAAKPRIEKPKVEKHVLRPAFKCHGVKNPRYNVA
jgi:hypothetical protein